MIRLLFYAVLILAGLIIGPKLMEHKGYILIAVGDYTVETSVVAAVLILLVGFGLLQMLEWLVVKSVNLTGHTLALPSRWRKGKAKKHTLTGALALAEEDWQRAEQAMARGAKAGELPAINLLAAARAAHQRGDGQAWQGYLEQAQALPGVDDAVALTRIRYLLNEHKYVEARQALEALTVKQQAKPAALRLALQLYRAQEDWDALARLIPKLTSKQVLTGAELADLPAEVESLCLAQCSSLEALEQRWRGLNRPLRKHTQVQLAYLQGLARFEQHEKARKLLLEKLDKAQPQPALLALLPTISGDAAESLSHVLHRRYPKPEQPELLDCMAALAEQQEQWAEAGELRQQALELGPTAERYRALVTLQERLGQRDEALNSYRALLALLEPVKP
ncbi:heme biosynthesis HemY N-terminal domain-containing protein [Ferrimonas marina]|uniref:HemY protein n=1 Tax=Ferrimonas marina TaxID=299255 RepID=A0A1M5XQ61_9GAMM|nr:heme biosynthesis HemY N-terminal domain-containing protein [Ferrimonas marina]SHI01985.1 HemY protein [Ferrimonas marina]